MKKNKCILVVGLGSIGRRHARLLAARGDLDVAWCEIHQEMIALARQEIGEPARLFGNFEEALASGPGYVLIATPQNLHCAQTVAALEAGIPVLCEKPLSDNLVDAERMVATVQATGGVCAVGFQSHFSRGHQRLREIVTSGVIGPIRHYHSRVGTYITLVNSKSAYQSRCEGALIQDYSHQPDLAQWILGQMPETVFAQGLTAEAMPLQATPNVLMVQFGYASNLLGSLHLNYLQMPQRHHYELVGEDGWVLFDGDTGEMRLGDRESRRVTTESYPFEADAIYIREHEAFLAAAAGERAPESSVEEALLAVKVADATIASWRSGQRVALEGVMSLA